jgi:alkanesulfonate monooxygenase SsuD/methylene tetrahydromethanopterin reductase-like flavin-dependent oxidoreductase (luciferase family)
VRVIKSWIFEFFATPVQLAQQFDAAASQRFFDAYLELWALAECVGFDGIFFSEHHFGAGYSPAPHLLIASVALRTSRIRLGVMGVVPAYHTPWQLVEEIGMLDHLTHGRLEIGTAAGIPQEMARVGMSVDEARARYDEAMEILDKALAEPVISHHGTFWDFDDLQLTPRPVQQPAPPKWVTVVSAASARKAAQRGAKVCTGFHPQDTIAEIFQAYRAEAEALGRTVGPEDLCLRRQVTLLEDDQLREEVLNTKRSASRERLKADPRLDLPERPAVLDTPAAHAFTLGDDEFVVGTPRRVAQEIIAQCRRTGAGNFAALFDRSMPPEALQAWYRGFGAEAIPLLRSAQV